MALTVASALLAVSLLLPYWSLGWFPPEHPAGLHVFCYLGGLEDGVSVAVGLASDGTVALQRSRLERSLAVASAVVICLLMVAAIFVHNRWAAMLALPAIVFPAIVLADTMRWRRALIERLADHLGEPLGALPWTPFTRLELGGGLLATEPGSGLFVAAAGSLTVLVGLWLHRRAWKPGVAGHDRT